MISGDQHGHILSPEALVADLVLDAEGVVAFGIDVDGLHDAGEFFPFNAKSRLKLCSRRSVHG